MSQYTVFYNSDKEIEMVLNGQADSATISAQEGTGLSTLVVDVDNTPTFDLEYIFLKLRANSVSDVAKFNITEDNGEESRIEIDTEPLENTTVGGTNKQN